MVENRTVCLMSGYNEGTPLNFNEKEIIRNFKERRRIMQDNGLELKLLVPQEKSWKAMGYSLGPRLYETIPDAIVQLEDEHPETDAYSRAIEWPRDIFQTFGKKVLAAPFCETYTPQILDALGKPVGQLDISYCGEGGFSVKARNLHIVPDVEKLNSHWKGFDWVGCKIYLMPHPASPTHKKTTHKKSLVSRMDNGHMDTEIGFAENSSGNAVLLVSQEYQQAYPREVNLLAEKLEAKPYVCTGERMAMNLITLPNGKVIVSEKYRSTIDFLKENLGEKSVIPLETLPGEINRHGGLRCRTNIIDLT